MAKYDDASWHYGGEFPMDLPPKNGATHIGMFLKWCIDKDLFSEELEEYSSEDIKLLKNRKITGAEFLINACDEKFTDSDLNDLGNAFAKDYYKDDTEFGKKYSSFADDYSIIFNKNAEENKFEYESFYHIEDTFENYNLMKPIIDKRFEEWKKYRSE